MFILCQGRSHRRSCPLGTIYAISKLHVRGSDSIRIFTSLQLSSIRQAAYTLCDVSSLTFTLTLCCDCRGEKAATYLDPFSYEQPNATSVCARRSSLQRCTIILHYPHFALIFTLPRATPSQNGLLPGWLESTS